MAESSTNGKKEEDENAERATALSSTHDSGSPDDVAPADDVDILARGSTVGRYLVLERLGAGAMGVVYAAYDPELDRKVAIKLLRPSEGRGDPARRQARLVREAKAMAKLSHANVGAIFDVGVHQGQVFLAIEYLPGGTLRHWLEAEKRPWREIVRMFIEVGHGLAAAHAEGLIHRDFKPDNVLLDKAGKPKVVDFGLVRLTAALDVSTTGSLDDADLPVAETAIPASSPIGAAVLTRTGALAGTPAYMAPEQFLGKAIDERTDQFAFCVALHEALYGERPFAGDSVIALADTVTSGTLREGPKDTAVPTWIRRLLLVGLATNPTSRWPSMDSLCVALADDPAVKRRRRVLRGSVVALGAAGVLVAREMVLQRRHETDLQVARHLESAQHDTVEARAKASTARLLRDRAFQTFDRADRTGGESIWKDARALLPAIDAEYDGAEQALQTALMLDQLRSDVQALLAQVTIEHFAFAEDFRLEGKLSSLRERMSHAFGGKGTTQDLSAPGVLVPHSAPDGARGVLETYERDPVTGRLSAKAVRPIVDTQPIPGLRPGSYRLVLNAPGRAAALFPFQVHRGEKVDLDLDTPLATAVPNGFVYVPPGDSWFGDSDEEFRAGFLDTVPIHHRHSDGFLISRNETTFAEWIVFLDSLSPAERKRRTPRGGVDASSGFVELKGTPDGWELTLRPAQVSYHAKLGEPIVYAGRDRRKSQDWRRLPVTGVSPDDAIAYATWLDDTHKVPGARLCTEAEWERAARGADERKFPHGDELAPEDANFDITYGRSAGYGPDEVGSYPASVSPFGVFDMVGNVWEITRSVIETSGFVVRGGSFYQFRPAQRSTNRNPVGLVTRDPTVGLRICATLAQRR